VQDRGLIQIEVSQLVSEIDRIAETTEFNRFKILNGSNVSFQFQVGANPGQNIVVYIKTMTSGAIGVFGINMATVDSANTALGHVDKAVDTVSVQRANFGAVQNRLEHVVVNLAVAGENLQAAESRIRDTDMAAEIVNFMRLKLMEDSGVAMLVQANVKPQSVLQLLP
jgi:flagellin